MNLPVLLRPEAEADIIANRDWYDRQRTGLGADFVEAVIEVIDRLKITPEQFAIAFRNIRRAKLRRFPHVVYFRVLGDRIEIIAVLHASRDPRLWQRRV